LGFAKNFLVVPFKKKQKRKHFLTGSNKILTDITSYLSEQDFYFLKLLGLDNLGAGFASLVENVVRK
jgi:hypothetical protein